MFFTISQAAAMIGVTPKTLRIWEKQGKIEPVQRTIGGHKRYTYTDIKKITEGDRVVPDDRIMIGYARISSHDQKADLERQAERLKAHCSAQYSYQKHEIIKDLGSGLNFKKRGLSKLLILICQHKISKIILTYRDRLLRFGFELIDKLANLFGTAIEILENPPIDSAENELARDVIELMTVFAAKSHGKRIYKNRQIPQNQINVSA